MHAHTHIHTHTHTRTHTHTNTHARTHVYTSSLSQEKQLSHKKSILDFYITRCRISAMYFLIVNLLLLLN